MDNYNDELNNSCTNCCSCCCIPDVDEDLRCSCVTMDVCHRPAYDFCDWDYGNPNNYAIFPPSYRRLKYMLNAEVTKLKELQQKITTFGSAVNITGDADAIFSGVIEKLTNSTSSGESGQSGTDTPNDNPQQNTDPQPGTNPQNFTVTVRSGILYVEGTVTNGVVTITGFNV